MKNLLLCMIGFAAVDVPQCFGKKFTIPSSDHGLPTWDTASADGWWATSQSNAEKGSRLQSFLQVDGEDGPRRPQPVGRVKFENEEQAKAAAEATAKAAAEEKENAKILAEQEAAAKAAAPANEEGPRCWAFLPQVAAAIRSFLDRLHRASLLGVEFVSRMFRVGNVVSEPQSERGAPGAREEEGCPSAEPLEEIQPLEKIQPLEEIQQPLEEDYEEDGPSRPQPVSIS